MPAPATAREAAAISRHGVRTYREAAKFLGCSRSKIAELIKAGTLYSHVQFGKRVIPVVELRRYQTLLTCREAGLV